MFMYTWQFSKKEHVRVLWEYYGMLGMQKAELKSWIKISEPAFSSAIA